MWWPRVRYVLLLAALCAIATCPAAKRACRANARAREADDMLEYLGDRVALVVASTGKLPPTPAGPTPQPGCCEQGGTCPADPSIWNTPGWRALGFSVDNDYRYTYQYSPDPQGTSAVLTAIGDLDCDGKSARFELKVALDPEHPGHVTRSWTRNDPRE